MIEPKRNYVKIIIGAVLVLIQVSEFPTYFKYPLSTQLSAAIAMSILLFLGGLYLLYTGLYPRHKS